MLASRRRCAFTGCLLSLSLVLGPAHVAVAQSAKGFAGQNCSCSKTHKGLVPGGAVPNQRFTAGNQPGASVPMATPTRQQNMSQQSALYPGQTTPWMLPNQTGAYPNQPLTGQPNFNQPLNQPGMGQAVPGWGQPGYGMQQPIQQVAWQFQPVAADPNQPGMIGGPAYVPPQPNQPGFLQNQPLANPNQPGNGQMIPVVVMQPGYLVPVQNPSANYQFQPPQATTPWLLQPGLTSNQPGANQACACNKQNGMMPSQNVAMQNPSYGMPNQAQPRMTTATTSHSQHGHCKKK